MIKYEINVLVLGNHRATFGNYLLCLNINFYVNAC